MNTQTIQQLRDSQRVYYWPAQHALVFASLNIEYILVPIGSLSDNPNTIRHGQRLSDVAPLPERVEQSLRAILDEMPYAEDDFTMKLHSMQELHKGDTLLREAIYWAELRMAAPIEQDVQEDAESVQEAQEDVQEATTPATKQKKK